VIRSKIATINYIGGYKLWLALRSKSGRTFMNNSHIEAKKETSVMNILAWIVLGGVAGWLASIVMKRNSQMGLIANIAAGIVGAVVGGWVFGLFGGTGVTGFNLTSLVVAFVGAVIVLAVVNFFLARK
jgi:uncharacterized membrane protein YeaQ/YmgE (transglycosylase-associated protein family)